MFFFKSFQKYIYPLVGEICFSLENFELGYVSKSLTEYGSMVHLEVFLVQRSRNTHHTRCDRHLISLIHTAMFSQ